jgi:hypothetical protein
MPSDRDTRNHRQDQKPDASDASAPANQRERRPSLKDLLFSDENRFEIDLPPRGSLRLRPVIRFEEE